MKSNQTQSYLLTLGLVAIIIFVNILIHIVLWEFQLWNLWAFLSLLIFIPVLLPLQLKQQNISSQKKKKLIKQALSANLPSFEYHPKSTISEADFKKSRLFNNVSYFYSGNTLLTDKKMDLSISNITVSHSLANDSSETPIFSGVLVKAKIPVYIDGFVLIKPIFELDNGQMPKLIKKLFQRYMPADGQRAYTKHAAFDQQFEIYTNIPNKLNEVIQSNLINQLLFFKKRLMELMHEDRETGKYAIFTKYSLLKNVPLEISISGDQLFIGIRNMNLFNTLMEENVDLSINKSMEVIYLINSINLRFKQ